MKVVHLSTSDSAGGAAIACKRISDALVSNGIESRILVQSKLSVDDKTYSTTKNIYSTFKYYARIFFDEGYIRLLTNQSRGRFSNSIFGIDVSSNPLLKNSDIIHLHWINGGFLSLKSFEQLYKLNKPIVWTLHDMWSFTGGCHYNLDCQKFKTECQNCPSLKFNSNKDVSNKIFNKKNKLYNKLNLTIVTCSKWLADEARSSSLLNNKKVVNIPNPIDFNVFKPMNKNEVRKKLNLPLDKFLILFGAMTIEDKRKGLEYLVECLNNICESDNELKNTIELIVVGSGSNESLEKLHYKIHFFGRIKDQSQMIELYNAANIYIAPSLQDNLPNTVLESLACGIPVLAFNIGGMKDMIDQKINGYLAEPLSVTDLSNGLNWLFNNSDEQMLNASRAKIVHNFTPSIIAKRYTDLYKEIQHSDTR